MDRLLNNLKQRVPTRQLQLPQEVDSLRLLETLEVIAQSNPHYVKTFFTTCLLTDPSVDQDEYYKLFGEVITSQPKAATDTDHVEYKFGETRIQIKETPRLISGAGTTGLRTWEAALFLTNYLLTEKLNYLKGKKILELGMGTGLISLALIKAMQKQYDRLIITDGDSSLIDALSYNLKLNNISLDDNPEVTCRALWWGQDTPPQSDVVIAADVTYDSSVIPFLVECISQALDEGAQEALIAATIRNEDTIDTFDNALTKKGLMWEVSVRMQEPSELEQDVWYAPHTPEIRIYSIRRSV